LRVATSLKLRLQDLREGDPLVPPRRLQFVGEGDFKATGEEFFAHFREVAGLQPDERILDVGCGIGRMARPLVGWLTGTYDGFDPNAVGIGWCQTRYPPGFRFTLVDLYNRRYHPTGTLKAADVRFPYDDEAFDFAILTSVLTHLLEEEAAHYLRETARVLRPGGRAVATFFLLDGQSRAAMVEERTALRFLQPAEHVAVLRDDVPEEAVAYDEGWVRARAREAGLSVREPVHPGTWRGGDGRSFQDLVVLDLPG
jgi:SAM-dependent methyltransferase